MGALLHKSVFKKGDEMPKFKRDFKSQNIYLLVIVPINANTLGRGGGGGGRWGRCGHLKFCTDFFF